MMDALSDPTIRTVTLMTSAQVGKALALDTLIRSPYGWTSMYAIKVGDTVYSDKGEWCSVTYVSPVETDRKCYEVRFGDGSSIVADEFHLWQTTTIDGKTDIRTTIQIKRTLKKGKAKQRNNHAIDVCRALQNFDLSLPISPYTLGVWLGDGNSHSANITFTKMDAQILDEIRKDGFGVRVGKKDPRSNAWSAIIGGVDDKTCRRGHEKRYHKYPNGYGCRECNRMRYRKERYGDGFLPKLKTFYSVLDENNLIANKHIPFDYLRASESQRRALLCGLMDTDGYCGESGMAEFCNTNKRIAEGVFELVASLGLKPTFKEGCATLRGVYVSPKYRVSFLAYSDSPIFRLKRKLARQRNISDKRARPTETRRRFITDVVPVSSVPVRCIRVDSPSHLFLAGKTLIPTHNTEVLNNIIGYFIDQDPSPMLMIQPTLEMGMAWSKDRFAPMVRDTKELYERVSDVKAKDGGNTILHKTFPGGHITVAGANSPASLASRPVRIVLFDEVDKYPPSAGTEGDPVKLGSKRTQTFWNRKEILTSTPTIKGISRIEHSYLSSDMRYYCVPCPKCSHFQKLMFKGLKWDKTESGYDMQSVHYECENCKEKLYEADKYRMVKKGEWRKTNPEQRTHAGFHISELYSPWSTWKQIVEDFLEAKKRPETLKVWQNTTLGESVEEEESFTISDEKLAARIEHYEVVPSGVLLLTCGIDIQEDRIELVVKGWGKADESWFIERRIFYGTTEALDTFKPLAEYLVSEFKHESGVSLKIVSVCIDSGFRSTVVYQFVKSMQSKVKYIFAVKGFGGYGRKFIGKVTNNNKYHARFLPLGVDEAKTTIYNRLAIDEPGTGYMHFNAKCDQDYFDQLTSEKHITKYSKGFPTRVWLLKKGKRNEMLDVEVYNLAAYTMLNANMEKVEAHFQSKVDRVEVKTDETPKEIDPAPRVRRNIPRKNFVTSW